MYIPAWLIVALLAMPPIARVLYPLVDRLVARALRPGNPKPRQAPKIKNPSRLGAVVQPLWLVALGVAVASQSVDVAPLLAGYVIAAIGIGWSLERLFFPANPRPKPASNWQPLEQEEAGATTSEWVAEKLRQAKARRA